MLHYELVKKRGCPLYECLYECLREDILRGRLLPGTATARPEMNSINASAPVSYTHLGRGYAP